VTKTGKYSIRKLPFATMKIPGVQRIVVHNLRFLVVREVLSYRLSRQVNQMLEPNTWYEINDQELFLFATNGFWDREERMQCYKRVKSRKIEKPQAGEP